MAIENLACEVSVNRVCAESAKGVCVVASVCRGLGAIAPSHSSARTTCLQRRAMGLSGLSFEDANSPIAPHCCQSEGAANKMASLMPTAMQTTPNMQRRLAPQKEPRSGTRRLISTQAEGIAGALG